MLCHEGDTVNFLGLEITKKRKGFEVKSSTDIVQSLLNLYGLQNSKLAANLGNRLTVMDLVSGTLLDGHDSPSIPDCHPTTLHTSPQSHDREQARSETVDTISQKARKTLVFVLSRAEWFKKVSWNSLVVVTQIGPAIRQHAKVLRDIIAVYRM